MPAGPARKSLRCAHQEPPCWFFCLVDALYTAPKAERKKLISEAAKRFPTNDAFISMSETIPERGAALSAFISNPTFMTLMQLSLRLAQNDEWKLLAEAMTLALNADVVDASSTPDSGYYGVAS